MGPMFRYERPQKGRYRQFYQLGAEILGQSEPSIDAELIMLTARWWKILHIDQYLSLELNSIGSLENRACYCKALTNFFKKHIDCLDKHYRDSIEINPMRILDKKNHNIKTILRDAPLLKDYLDQDSNLHFSNVCKVLDSRGIKYVINPYLVRGLDYYNSTVFEWITNKLDSQNTICAGGRYDKLSEQLGYYPIPAVGCAIGLERLISLINHVHPLHNTHLRNVDIYFIVVGNDARLTAILIAEKIRDVLPMLHIITDYTNNSFKKQFSYANKSGAHFALVIGQHELITKKILIKNLITRHQELLTHNEIIIRLKSVFNDNNV